MSKLKPVIDNLLIQKYKESERELLNKVLESILKRKPTEDDYKKVEFGTIKGREGEILIKFDDVFIGRFIVEMKTENESTKFIINFIPNNPIQTKKSIK